MVPMPVDRLHHAHAGEHHRAVILGSVGNAMRGGLNLLHSVFGFRDLFRQPGDRILERDELAAVGQPDRFVEAVRPGHCSARLFQKIGYRSRILDRTNPVKGGVAHDRHSFLVHWPCCVGFDHLRRDFDACDRCS
jgi:hypothetical protein